MGEEIGCTQHQDLFGFVRYRPKGRDHLHVVRAGKGVQVDYPAGTGAGVYRLAEAGRWEDLVLTLIVEVSASVTCMEPNNMFPSRDWQGDQSIAWPVSRVRQEGARETRTLC